LTIKDLATTFERVTGIPAEYQPMKDEEFMGLGLPNGHDVVNQFRFHREYSPERDYEALRKIYPGLRSFETWLRETGWHGEPRSVQKGAVRGDS
jgi:hypothetical protein